MSDHDKDRFDSIRKNLQKKESTPSKISANDLEGDIVKNLRLLKAMIQSEKVKGNLIESAPSIDSAKTPVEKVQARIIEELFDYNIENLAQFEVPKRYFDECFELLISAWKRRIQQSFSQTITLSKIRFSKSSFRAFVIALSLNVTLKAVRLESCHLRDYEMKLLAVFIKVHPSVVFLHLDHNKIKDQGLEPLLAGLSFNSTIEHLSLVETGLTDEGALLLLDHLKKHPLKSLNIEKNELSERSLDPLCGLFYKNGSDLFFDQN